MVKKANKWVAGRIVTVPLGEGRASVARLLHEPLIEFYDMVLDVDDELAPERVSEVNPIFRVWVMKRAVDSY